MKLYTEEQVKKMLDKIMVEGVVTFKDIIDCETPIELSVVEIKQSIKQSITNTKLTISEKHYLAVSIFEKLGGEVKSYIDEETKSDIVNKLTKKWNSGNQNK